MVHHRVQQDWHPMDWQGALHRATPGGARVHAGSPPCRRRPGPQVWTFHEHKKYEFDLEFDLPVAYPSTPPELALPELDGKTEKMYRGGKICLDVHFAPLWSKNTPRFGIAHAMALGMAPWLAVEIPSLVSLGRIKETEGEGS